MEGTTRAAPTQQGVCRIALPGIAQKVAHLHLQTYDVLWGRESKKATMTGKAIGRIGVQRREPLNVQERRREPRAPLAVPIKLTVGTAHDAVDGRAVNISHGGMFIATNYPPKAGTMIDIELALPDRRLLMHAQGEVIRIASTAEPPGVGVRFVNVSYQSQELIDALVSAGMGKDEY